MEIQMKVTGMESLIENIKKITGITEQNLYQAIKKGATLVVNSAIKRCPVDTGLLRSNIRMTEPEKNQNEEITAKVGVNENVKYAVDVEFPTRRHLAYVGAWGKRHGFGKAEYLWVGGPGKEQPFLYPAFNEHFLHIQNMISEAIKKDWGK